MATSRCPREPLLVVMGTTGTGKSDLAVDLAVRFNGEVINADAMQMYKGLPIITNQISVGEQRGIPHHLLATIEIDQPTWTVSSFAREAKRLIHEIRARGRLPIIVGGTHYYINSLLFDASLVESSADDEVDAPVSETEIGISHPILDSPTDLIYRRLQEVDPVMAARWHPDDRRKIRRSLEIFLTTGRRASDVYAEQQATKAAKDGTECTWDTLLFWVYSQPEVLKERLSKRVLKMERSGLIGEVRELRQHFLNRTSAGENVDRTRGIWQSIGFKQFAPFLDAEDEECSPSELEKLRSQSIELTQIANRQYARYQLKWLRTKTIPELRESNAMHLLYLLDSTDNSRFSKDVLVQAADITQDYLDGHDLPEPASVSSTAREMLSAFSAKKGSKPQYDPRFCDVCNMTLQTEDQWIRHVKGRRHRGGLRHKARTSLVPVDDSGLLKKANDHVQINDLP